MENVDINVEVTRTVTVTVNTGIRGEQGQKGDPGEGATDLRIWLIGETISDGQTGVSIPLTGMTQPDDYIVQLNYLGNPQGSGIPYVERNTNYFIIKHYGSAKVPISYLVLKKEV